MVARTVLVWLIVLTSGWSWMVQGQSAGIEIVSSGPVSGFFLVTCVGTVPGITNVNDVDIQFSTVNDRAGMQPDTNRMGNPRFERAIFFSSLQPSDSGTYTCRVLVNGAQVIAETFVIDVESGILATLVQPIMPVIVGQDSTLNCIIILQPPSSQPSIEWLGANGGPVPTNDTRNIISQGSNSSLQFRPPQESHSGNYTCQININNSRINNVIEVQVNIPDITLRLITPDSPVVGMVYRLDCQLNIANDLRANISYALIINGVASTFPTAPSREISPLTYSDAGEYQCAINLTSPYLINMIERTSMVEVRLTLPTPSVNLMSNTSSPVPFLSSPVLTCTVNLDQDVNVGVTLNIELTGPAGGQASSMITPMVFPSSQSLFSTTLQLNDTAARRDRGNYTCRVTISSNVLQGFIMDSAAASDIINIDVIASPPNITSFELREQSRQVFFEWSQSQLDDIIRYFVRVNTTTSECNVVNVSVTQLEGGARRFQSVNLEEFSDVEVILIASSSAGNTSSLPLTLMTPSAAPQGMPQLSNTSNISSITISWDRVNCLERNSQIIGYLVTVDRLINQGRSVRQVLDGRTGSFNITGTDVGSRTFTINGLLPRISYRLSVSAMNNDSGTGPAAEITITTPGPRVVGLLHRGQLLPNNSIVTANDFGLDFNSIICFTSETNCCGSDNGGELGRWSFPDGTEVSSGNISISRGLSIISLNQNQMGEEGVQSGLFRCDITDMGGNNQTVYVGVYNDSNEGAPELMDLSFDVSSGDLTCISTGGPASTVEWKRNGLETNFPQSQIVRSTQTATYINRLFLNREPDNIVGNYTCSVTNLGGSEIRLVQLRGMDITGLLPRYIVGNSLSLSCFTDLSVSNITWFDQNSRIVARTTSDSRLNLTRESVTADDTQFTCVIRSQFGTQSRVITIVIDQDPNLSIVGGVVGGVVALLILIVIVILLCCFCLGVRSRKFTEHYDNPNEIYTRTTARDSYYSEFEEHPDGSINGVPAVDLGVPLNENGVGMTEGWKRIQEPDNLEESQRTLVNPEALYANTTFIARDREEPIEVAKFESHVQHMHSGKNFETEYMLISRTPQSSYDVSCMTHNKNKNRFANIFPYDDNRVKLKVIAGVKGSDYINASYVDKYKQENGYIAAQGPNPESLSDFWRMIWECRVPTLVMLTRCYEGGKKKCVQYWPEKMEEPFLPGQSLTVSLISVTPYSNYIMRKMSVRSAAEPDTAPLEVTQFHFLGWPDHGVPTNALSLINFIKRVRKVHPHSNKMQLLVHCSAGVGRTGTFITLDSMLERIKEEQTIDIFPFVSKIRKQRVLMVQTAAQYMFIFDALNEYIICGETEIQASNLEQAFEKLSKVSEDGKTGFEQQYELLNHMTHILPDAKYGHAKAAYNAKKNRYSHRIPNYFTRVRLRPNGEDGSDYINASFIDGYKNTQALIATQGPLQNTVDDFWRMIHEFRSKCIVMLCRFQENGKDYSARYWPEEILTPVFYGKVTVTKTVEEAFPDYIMRKFEIHAIPPKAMSMKKNSLSPSFVVTQYHYINWPEHDVPKSTKSILEVLQNVERIQLTTGNKAVTVMCNNGVGRTGAFIGIYSQLERLKTEGEIDLFQYIKSVRIQRAGLILDTEQYVFCYRVLLDYLKTNGYAA